VLCASTPSLPCCEDQEPRDEAEPTDPDESPEPEQCDEDQSRCAGKAAFFTEGNKDVAIDGCVDVGREPPHPHADRESAKSTQDNAKERATLFLTPAESHPISLFTRLSDNDHLLTLSDDR
jgi:hypothetical protein